MSAIPNTERSLRLLLDLTNRITSNLELRELLRAISANIREVMHCDSVGISLPDGESGQFRLLALDFPAGKGFVKEELVATPGAVGRHALDTRRPLILRVPDDIPPELHDKAIAEGLKSICVIPLVSRGRAVGVLTIGRVLEGAFSQDDVEFMSQAGGQIAIAIENALAYQKISELNEKLAQERLYLEDEIRSEFNFENIVGKSPALQKVLDQIAVVAPTDSTVLLHGETGTGKELIARAVHSLSPRKGRTFVRLNCAAIPSGLVESELFGHEKGAFTGALMQKKGRFEISDRGTLFLDEIGDITLELQPKLLRAIQEQEFERLGSTKTIHVDVRLIAATHRDLPAMIRNSQFREDLFYRLNVFPVEIPPLRERREDIPLLVHFFASRLSRRMQKKIRTISQESMDGLIMAPWPGNIRELENFIERAVILSQGEELKVPLQELELLSARPALPDSTLEAAERQAIIEALKAASGRISGSGGAAERLGLKRTTLQNKMRKLAITRPYR